MTEPGRSVRYSYDLAGRITRERVEEVGVAGALETGYAYDPDGALSSLTYPSGLRLELVRDAATGDVSALVNAATGLHLARNVTRAPGGPIQSLTFGNDRALSQTVNLRYEPVTVSSGPVAFGYGMTAAGDVSSITAGSVTRAFQYDYLGELAGSTGWLKYTYSSNGNRTSDSVDGTFFSHQYAYAADRVTQSLSNSPVGKPVVYGYDRQSNVSALAQKPSGAPAVAVCLRHDPLGRMVLVGTTAASAVTADVLACLTDDSVTQPVARFRYDHRARRVARWLASTNEWTHVVSDASGNPLSELALTGDPANPWRKVRDYVWLDGRPLAQIEYPGPAGSAEGHVYYFHLDHIGLPRALTNAAGQTVWSASTRPYGDLVERTTTDPLSGQTVVTNLRLPGQYDERLFAQAGISGMQGPYYNWHRWYLPSVGRYLELDPLALEGDMNNGVTPDWYNYANGNPLRWTDERGTDTAVDIAVTVLFLKYLNEQFCKNKDTSCSCKCFGKGANFPYVDRADSPAKCAELCTKLKNTPSDGMRDNGSIYKYQCGTTKGFIH